MEQRDGSDPRDDDVQEMERRRRHDHERELHWKRYESPPRRRLAEEYHRSRGDADVVRGGTPLDPHDGRRVLEDPDY